LLWSCFAAGTSILRRSVLHRTGRLDSNIYLSTPLQLRSFRSLLACAILLTAACSDSTDTGPVAASVQLDQASVSVPDGQTVRIIATVLDRNGNVLSPLPAGATIVWTTSDAAVASVTGGFVTANRPGTANVTAAVGSASATAAVSVSLVPSRIERADGEGQQGIGGEELGDSLLVRVTDRHGTPAPGVALSWEVTSGQGAVAGAPISDAAGFARAAWRLGGIGGTQTVVVRSPQIGGASAAFSATAVGGPDAPFITSVTPATLRPGETAVIGGGNLDLDLPALLVTVAGAPAEVVSVTATELTIRVPARSRLPCEAVVDVALGVTSRGFTAIHTHPLRPALERALAVGGSLTLAGADDLACNQLPAGRYLISAFNSSPVIGAAAPVQLRGRSTDVEAVATVMPHQVTPSVGRAPRGALHAGREIAESEHERILRRNHDLLRTLSPGFRERRALGRTLIPTPTAAPAQGDTITFRVPRTSAPSGQICSSYDVVRARAVYVGPRAIVFEDVTAPLAGTMDATYVSMGEEYEGTMHPTLLEFFGNPLALGAELSNPERVYMLFTRAVNDDNPNIAGFVFSGDLFPRDQCASSDRAAIFYAAVPTLAGSSFEVGRVGFWQWTMRSTVIHEVKHITSFAERLSRDASRWEESWLEEATARVSEELWARKVFGYSQRGNVSYSQSIYCEARPNWSECEGSPYVMLKHFSGLHTYLVAGGSRSPLGSAAPGDASFYGSGWSLVRWAIDRQAGEAAFLRALTQEPHLSGIANLEARAGLPFAQILPRWSLALAGAGLPGFQPEDPSLTFPGWNLVNMFAGLNTDFPQSFNSSPQRVIVGPGSFDRPEFPLVGGATTVFELLTSTVPRTLQLRGGAGADPASTVGLSIVRIN
jgi:hypothetical protein